MYEYLLNATESFIRYGMSPTALIVALIALFKTKIFKRFVGRHAPWMFRDDADVLNYQDRQIRIENKLDALLSSGGVSWDADWKIGKNAANVTDGVRRNLTSSQAGYVLAASTALFTRVTEIFHSRGGRTMKTYLSKLSSTKLQALIIATIMNIALLVGYVMDVQDIQSKVDAWMPMVNMLVQTLLTIAYQWSRASVDKAEIKAQTPIDPGVSEIEKSYHSE